MNIKTVAKEAGVSVATVSRVLNNSDKVRDKTKKAVLDTIERLEYIPNDIARGLRVSKSQTIGVIIPDITNIYFSNLLKGIQDEAYKNGYNIIIVSTDMDDKKEIQAFDLFCNKKIDGIIYLAHLVNDEILKLIKKYDIPIVLSSAIIEEKGIVNIGIDNELAAYDATEYLIKLGHRDIAILTGLIQDYNSGFPRLNGYKKALMHYGISINEDNIYHGNYHIDDGINIAKMIIKNNRFPSAIFCTNDIMAMGFIHEMTRNGYKIPEDISVMGFDNIDISNIFNGGITTVSQPIYEIGAKSVGLLMDRLDNREVPNKNILSHEIIVRNTAQENKEKGDG